MTALNEQLLDERLGQLETAQSWSPRVVSRLEAVIRAGEDFALFRVNPLQFAREHNISETEAIDLFLHATAVRLFAMDWMVICPLCSSVVESFGSLQAVDTGYYHCHFCQNAYEAALDDYIAVCFTVVPNVRQIIFHTPERLPPFEYLTRYAFPGEHIKAEVPAGVFALSRKQIVELCLRRHTFLAPGESTTVAFAAGEAVEPGASTVFGNDVLSGAYFQVYVREPSSSDVQRLTISFRNGAWAPAESHLHTGQISLELRNDTARPIFANVAEFPDALPHCSVPLVLEPYLSAKRLLTTQKFRDLFRAEVIKGAEGIGVRDITLVFTDLKGSTELYERIGDLNAFALVQQHFERLTEVTVRNGGVVVKTLGDAVMAAFMTAADAVSGALAMQAEISAFNETRPERDLLLKIGVHRGAAIAVTSNDRLDYFGQSVNIASRVGALAEGGEICLTREVHDAPGVREQLDRYRALVSPARLKGMDQAMPIWRVREQVPAAAVSA